MITSLRKTNAGLRPTPMSIQMIKPIITKTTRTRGASGCARSIDG